MEEKNPFAAIKTYDNYTHLLELTALVIVLQMGASLAVYFWERSSGIKLSTFEGMIPALLATGWISWLMLDGIGISWRGAILEWKARPGRDLAGALKYFVGYAALLAVIGLVLLGGYYVFGDKMSSAIQPLEKNNIAENVILQKAAVFSRLHFLLVIFSACVVAPVVEEVFFRRIFFTTLRVKNGFWFSAFWSGLVFALFHGTGAPIILPIGIYLCWVYEKERRLPVNIMLHSLVNLSMISLKVLIK